MYKHNTQLASCVLLELQLLHSLFLSAAITITITSRSYSLFVDLCVRCAGNVIMETENEQENIEKENNTKGNILTEEDMEYSKLIHLLYSAILILRNEMKALL